MASKKTSLEPYRKNALAVVQEPPPARSICVTCRWHIRELFLTPQAHSHQCWWACQGETSSYVTGKTRVMWRQPEQCAAVNAYGDCGQWEPKPWWRRFLCRVPRVPGGTEHLRRSKLGEAEKEDEEASAKLLGLDSSLAQRVREVTAALKAVNELIRDRMEHPGLTSWEINAASALDDEALRIPTVQCDDDEGPDDD